MGLFFDKMPDCLQKSRKIFAWRSKRRERVPFLDVKKGCGWVQKHTREHSVNAQKTVAKKRFAYI